MKTIEELRTAVSDPRAAASLTVPELQRLRAWGEYERARTAEARARSEYDQAKINKVFAEAEFRRVDACPEREEAESLLREARNAYLAADSRYIMAIGEIFHDPELWLDCSRTWKAFEEAVADFEKRFGPVVKDSLTPEPERQ